MSIQDIISAWNANAETRDRVWRGFPPLQKRFWKVVEFYNGTIATRSLPPAPHPCFVRDMKTAYICQWTDDLQKGTAYTVLGWYERNLTEPIEPGFVYILEAVPYYKIGRTVNPSSRIKTIDLQMPFPVTVYGFIPSYNAAIAEAELHRAFDPWRANGEWFSLNKPGTIAEAEYVGLDFLQKHVPALKRRPHEIKWILSGSYSAKDCLEHLAATWLNQLADRAYQ